MKTKLLTTLVACALLISLMGCAADKTAQMLQDTADVTVNTEALTQHSADTQAVTPTAETAEKEMPDIDGEQFYEVDEDEEDEV